VYVQASASEVPRQPSIVRPYGRLLRVQDRLPDGRLGDPYHYAIKGVAWSPSSVTTTGDLNSRRAEFANWYVPDIQLMKTMNANTVYTYVDFGTDTNGWQMLDYLYENGLKAIVTVDNGYADTNILASMVSAYRDHPAILAWGVGNEWTVNLYHRTTTVTSASLQYWALFTEQMAQLIKSLDPNHPVASLIGDLDPYLPLPVSSIVNSYCPSVDIWGLNVYRGATFFSSGYLFYQWSSLSQKPMFLSEYGTDVVRTRKYNLASKEPTEMNLTYADGTVEPLMQAEFNRGLWEEIVGALSAARTGGTCLGGCVFEWNDEWWKATRGVTGRHDYLGIYTRWNPNAMPDSIANEEWFGLVAIDRSPRLTYTYYQEDFARLQLPADYDQDGMADSWEYRIVDAADSDAIGLITKVLPDDDFDGDGASNLMEYAAATDPTDPASFLRFAVSLSTDQIATVQWQGGTEATQILESSDQLAPADWTPRLTNSPPTSVTNVFVDGPLDGTPARYYRLRLSR
jgi:hypothetical protein